jgi:hypothetical protein
LLNDLAEHAVNILKALIEISNHRFEIFAVLRQHLQARFEPFYFVLKLIELEPRRNLGKRGEAKALSGALIRFARSCLPQQPLHFSFIAAEQSAGES